MLGGKFNRKFGKVVDGNFGIVRETREKKNNDYKNDIKLERAKNHGIAPAMHRTHTHT